MCLFLHKLLSLITTFCRMRKSWRDGTGGLESGGKQVQFLEAERR